MKNYTTLLKQGKKEGKMTLVEYIDELNAKAKKQMKANPNLWIGMLTNDPKHWAGYGIYTVKELGDYLDAQCGDF